MVLFILSVLISLALAFDYSTESSVVFLPVFAAGLTAAAVVRYVRASRR